MFDSLTRSFDGIRQRLVGKKKLTEDNVSDALREVRVALLEADVNYKVCKAFIARIKEKATGDEVEFPLGDGKTERYRVTSISPYKK